MPIAIITVIRGRRRMMQSARACCATVISTIIHIIRTPLIFCALLLLASSCKEDAPERRSSSAHQATSSAHERGQQNASAMQENAGLCETSEGTRDLAACKNACQLNHSNSCANWGQLVAELEPEHARELYDRACRGGSGIGCELRARLAALEKQSDANELFASARGYHRVHCSQGYARSCAQLAQLYREGLGGTPDSQAAREFQRRACTLGWQLACPTE